MNEPENKDDINWSLTTWEGSRREQIRRWSQLTLREILLAQEEMQELAERFHKQKSTSSNTKSE